MKLISETTIHEKAKEYGGAMGNPEKPINATYDGFIEGASFAESLLLPKMIKFAEWIRDNFDQFWNLPDEENKWGKWFEKKSGKSYTTSELLDIWIEQNKHE